MGICLSSPPGLDCACGVRGGRARRGKGHIVSYQGAKTHGGHVNMAVDQDLDQLAKAVFLWLLKGKVLFPPLSMPFSLRGKHMLPIL